MAAILLTSVDFKVDRDVLDPGGSNQIKPSYGGRVKEVAFNADQGNLICTIEWTVDFRSGRKRFVKCAAEYEVAYEGLESFQEATVSLLAENVARPASYAYFRALFANLDWSAELRSPPLLS
ncbi:hypothetical protein [Bradyrhizobium glycinis]|uniref:hypothetical protein n=1 Tax=Bradyrhizobium glycinis TaxID=2751812 RepID=UPI0018D5AA4C|nr:hypothetical protein [Bradyrhizobium glycinis]MBH5372793.1 hypothetical protein [Bradyrhizobium glycinis]